MAISVNQKGLRLPDKALETQSKPKPAKSGAGFLDTFVRSIKPKEMIFFTSQLALMLENGTPLKASLDAIGEQTQNPSFKKVIQSMSADIQEGRQLSEAMKRHDRVFDEVFISMIKAGETGGFLKKILDRMVQMQERRQALISQLKSALTYPMFLCGLGFIVVVFILVAVLPKFTAFFQGKESVLPLTTRFLMSLSASLQNYWWAYLLCGAGLAFSFVSFKKSKAGQAVLDRFFISGPLISKLYNKMYTCDFLRTLGNLMQSQVPLLEALGVTRGTIKNRYFKQFIDQINEHVQQGGKFSQPFAGYPYIIPSVKQMVATGEEAGNLPGVMLSMADFYDKEVEQNLKSLSALIEPIALVVLGGVVGLIVSSIILPMFKLAQAMH
jgi:type II secretory pathway component PulF